MEKEEPKIEDNKRDNNIEDNRMNREYLLQLKRHRENDLDMLEFDMRLLVYIDYWIELDRFIPLAIRICNPKKRTIETCLYDKISLDTLKSIKHFYGVKQRRPFWVDYISDTKEAFLIALSNHYEKYDVTWITQDAVNYILELNNIELYTISNHASAIEKYYNCSIQKVYFTKSEIAYKVDFLIDILHNVKHIDSVELNNMNQAITAIAIKIRGIKDRYPTITNNPNWKQLARMFLSEHDL